MSKMSDFDIEALKKEERVLPMHPHERTTAKISRYLFVASIVSVVVAIALLGSGQVFAFTGFALCALASFLGAIGWHPRMGTDEVAVEYLLRVILSCQGRAEKMADEASESERRSYWIGAANSMITLRKFVVREFPQGWEKKKG